MTPQLRRLVVELGPLLVFFISFRLFGIFGATAVFMVAVLVALAVSWHLERRLSPVPLLTAILVMIFGGLTLYLRNDTFIKMKPTVLYACFGLILLGGLASGRLFIKYVFATAFELDEAGWKKLTLRWGIFFLALAATNEVVWRSTSTATWVSFKVWGLLVLVFLFALAQTPLLMKHQLASDKPTQE
ncbi:MAG TPA: septation protein A [Rhizomicrobium sp.]|jgi:intracellular septation protein|nr:septation protein A [Rhizomicrobium sp.]